MSVRLASLNAADRINTRHFRIGEPVPSNRKVDRHDVVHASERHEPGADREVADFCRELDRRTDVLAGERGVFALGRAALRLTVETAGGLGASFLVFCLSQLLGDLLGEIAGGAAQK